MFLAAFIFIVTLILVIWQPRGLGIGVSAILGAVLALIAGVISLDDIPVVWDIVWNATFAFIAIIIISLLLDQAGFFEWIALHVARFAGGNANTLFALIVLLGAVVSALFANDGAALILTPIVIAMLLKMRVSAATTLAFIMAAGFIADTASLPLVVSNLVNIVSADFFNISFDRYAQVMLPVNLVSVFSSLVVLYLFYRRDIPKSYDVDSLPEPATAIKDSATFYMGWLVLAALLLGFFVLEPMGMPISVIAGVGAATLVITALVNKKLSVPTVLKSAPWQVVVFSLGMYLVVYGLKNEGLTDYLTQALDVLGQQGLWIATIGTGFMSAGLSSIMNNMPTVLIQSLAIADTTQPDTITQAMVYANVIGSDLGPKITPIGSLATLLWLHVLASKDVVITWGYYFKVGIILTVPVLLATLTALVLWLPMVS
ncbi:arsenic transporter [Psychrobacter sanguinis]|uniref:arsenic transporter n=1 Tax=Psychrobacter sanguinis TaxID=861445 RepID=UPI00191B0F73|nr:arsenic transporter [Psychrobacter sanguinis]MCC3307805.1 arsenic transporter [Psychrobacter sanguinis]UEC25102.1 arsenic transporter [Psychrobacter sanguinis]